MGDEFRIDRGEKIEIAFKRRVQARRCIRKEERRDNGTVGGDPGTRTRKSAIF